MPRLELIQHQLAYPESIKALSYFDLSYLTLMASYDQMPTQAEKDTIHTSVLEALNNHWCNFDILNTVATEIRNSAGLYPPIHYLDSLIHSVNNSSGRNLINTNRIYYHRHMLLLAPPATLDWDDNAGKFETKQPEYWCENKSEITVSDIWDYFYSKSQDAYGERVKNYGRAYIIKCLKSWVDEPWFDVDLMLFAIDATINANETTPVKSFLAVQDYMFQAGETLKGKQDSIVSSNPEGGAPFVIPRHRELLY